MRSEEARNYIGALVYVPGNKRIRFGKLTVWADDLLEVEALQNKEGYSPETETISGDKFEIAILAK